MTIPLKFHLITKYIICQVPYLILCSLFLTEIAAILCQLVNGISPWDEVYNFEMIFRTNISNIMRYNFSRLSM